MVNILLIEDDRSLRENTKEILELAGYNVETAENGRKGVQLALSKDIDLILCDIIMPVLDGYSVLKELSTVPRTQKILFIFLTAKSGLKEIRAGMNLGADDYLVKPFEEQELLDTIHSRLLKFQISHKYNSNNSKNGSSKIADIQHFKEYFIENGEKKNLMKNEVLFRENNLSRYVYFLKKGLIKTFKMDEYGKELITGIYHKESFLGLYSFNGLVSYPESSLAMGPSLLYRLPSNFLREAFKYNTQLTMELAQNIAEEIIELKNHLLQTAYSSALRKTINTILDFSQKMKFEENEMGEISRSDLANIAGISKESFIRCLSTLKNEGFINIEGRNFQILNMSGLRKIK